MSIPENAMSASLLALSVALMLPSGEVAAAMTATRSPNALGVLEYKTGNGSTISLNDALIPDTSKAGVVTKTKVLIDQTQGTIKGFAGIDGKGVPADQADVAGALASGVFGATGVLMGPAGPATISLVFDFDGKMIAERGRPSLLLIGNVSASVGDYSYISQLGFSDDGSQPQAFTLKVARRWLTSAGNPYSGGADFAGATPEVLDSNLASAAGRAKITLQASAGDTITFSSTLAGNAGTAFVYGSQPTDSAGFVDFLNTGTLRIFLPAGYSLAGDSPLLKTAVSVVPEPTSGLLFVIGALALAVTKRRTLKAERALRLL